MQAEKSDPMKDALSARRGKGLEIIIGLGKPDNLREEDADIKSGRSDLAPPPDGTGDREAPMESASGLHAPHPDGVVAAQHTYAPGDVPTPDDARAHFSENMSENDIRDMANRKPRSLAERARQYAFEKKK